MTQLSSTQIEKYASLEGVKRIAVENFLMSLSGNAIADSMNLGQDAGLYKWNTKTVNAIKKGIFEAYNPKKK